MLRQVHIISCKIFKVKLNVELKKPKMTKNV